MGMGGAGVAVTRGALSTYWNPAGLAPPRAPSVNSFWDVAVPVSANAAAPNDILRDIDDVVDLVRDLDFPNLETKLSNPGTPLTSTEIQKSFRLLTKELPELGQNGSGLVANASASLMARIWRFGFSALFLTYAGDKTKVDLTNLALGNQGIDGVVGPGSDRSGQLSGSGQAFADSLASQGIATQDQAEEIVFQAEQAGINTGSDKRQNSIRNILLATQANNGGSSSNFFTQNQSGLDTKGILIEEYALSYSRPFLEIFSLGVSAKLLYGITYFKPLTLQNLQNTKETFDDLFDLENKEESFNYGIDVGALVEPLPWFSLGIVARNVNRPKFDFLGPGDYVVEPQIRAGVGFTPPIGLTLAADIDVYANHSEALPGYDSQVISAGAEYSIFDVLFLRAGLSKNLAQTNEDMVMHAGLGLRILYVQLDVALGLTPHFTELTTDNNNVSVPERAGLSVQLGVNIPLE
jgi:hypothetical protein